MLHFHTDDLWGQMKGIEKPFGLGYVGNIHGHGYSEIRWGLGSSKSLMSRLH